MVTYNQVLAASLALSAKLVSAVDGVHHETSIQHGGTYSATACKNDPSCISEPHEGNGELSTMWIILIVIGLSIPIVGAIVYTCFCHKKQHNVDDEF